MSSLTGTVAKNRTAKNSPAASMPLLHLILATIDVPKNVERNALTKSNCTEKVDEGLAVGSTVRSQHTAAGAHSQPLVTHPALLGLERVILVFAAEHENRMVVPAVVPASEQLVGKMVGKMVTSAERGVGEG